VRTHTHIHIHTQTHTRTGTCTRLRTHTHTPGRNQHSARRESKPFLEYKFRGPYQYTSAAAYVRVPSMKNLAHPVYHTPTCIRTHTRTHAHMCKYVNTLVLQRVAVCCSVLQCVAVCCNVLQCVAVRCSVLRCVGDPNTRRTVRLSHVALPQR